MKLRYFPNKIGRRHPCTTFNRVRLEAGIAIAVDLNWLNTVEQDPEFQRLLALGAIEKEVENTDPDRSILEMTGAEARRAIESEDDFDLLITWLDAELDRGRPRKFVITSIPARLNEIDHDRARRYFQDRQDDREQRDPLEMMDGEL
jgi:hypothetical protein